jgi:hypothetical protein
VFHAWSRMPLMYRTFCRSLRVHSKRRRAPISGLTPLLVAGALFAALIVVMPASASSVASARGHGDTPHDCKCATKCRGDSCCCGPHEKPSRVPESSSSSDLANRIDASSCQMNSAPCGDSGLPNERSERPVSKNLAFQMLTGQQLDTRSELFALSSQSLPSLCLVGRVDRPPEDLVLA